MFGNLKIGVRLITGFVLVAAISLVVGLIGISNASKLDGMADKMYTLELMGLSYVKEANEELAATAEEMSTQAEQLQQTMAFFELAGNKAGAIASRRSTPKSGRAMQKPTAGRTSSGSHTLANVSQHDPDESEFSRF